MQVTYVRCLGGLALVWSVRTWIAMGGWPSLEVYLVAATLYTLAAVWLLGGRHVPVGATMLLLASATQLWAQDDANSPVLLLAWAALIVLLTEDHPHERALLLRVAATCVYAFTGLAKINPAFLAGDQLVGVAATRDHLGWALGPLSGTLGILAAWSTVATELWLAIGLWFRRTRAPTAAVGVLLHVVLVPVAAVNWTTSLAYAIVLNLSLLAMYPAFWAEIAPAARQPSSRAINEVALHSSRT
jgi:hypothetical protein